MLKRLAVRDFKSLASVTVELPRMSVLFGPNTSGKSNFLDAIHTLSSIGTERTLQDALGARMLRGYPIEAITLPANGLPGLLSRPSARFSLEADLSTPQRTRRATSNFRYRIEVEIKTNSGKLSNSEEFLCALSQAGSEKGKAAIEVVNEKFRVRRQKSGGSPRFEPLELNYSILSDQRLVAPNHEYIERFRNELLNWQTYYLDPRLSMRRQGPPADVVSIGAFGEDLVPFLYKLKAANRKHFDTVIRSVRSIIRGIEHLDITLDRRQGVLDLALRQDGTDYSLRVVSEGTLRVLGLCSIAANPWAGSLLAFEEPENGVHPRRLELIAKLLVSVALDAGRQIVVTTHSPLFCGAVIKEARLRKSDEITLFNVRRSSGGTSIEPFQTHGPLFEDPQIREALSSDADDGMFEALLMRGLFDE